MVGWGVGRCSPVEWAEPLPSSQCAPRLPVLTVCRPSISQSRSEAFGRKQCLPRPYLFSSFQSMPSPLMPTTSTFRQEIVASSSLGLSGKPPWLSLQAQECPGGCGLRCAPFNVMVGSRPRKVVLVRGFLCSSPHASVCPHVVGNH